MTKFQHCIDYLTWTYFFRRLTKNPAYYGLKNDIMGNIADSINKYLSNLVETTLVKLQNAGCIEYDKADKTIAPTTLGYLASYYYLSHETIKHLGDNLGPKTKVA